MKVQALRGVCIGVDRHLVAGDSVDLESALANFLVSIGAVALVKDEPVSEPVPAPESESKSKPVKAGKEK